MVRSSIVLVALTAIFVGFLACTGSVSLPSSGKPVSKPAELNVPEGFKIEVFAEDVLNARQMCVGDNGTIFVSTRSAGRVYALVDLDGDNRSDTMYILASGKYMPNGITFQDGSLYVAEVDRIWRLDDIENNLASPPERVIVKEGLPDESHHGWKYLGFGPDGKLYVPVGAPCNVCEKEEEIFATIMRMNQNGDSMEVFASGIRNSVGFDWDPNTGDLWFTDNGRDWLGDDLPADELNHAPTKGLHFGFPYCHQGDTPDPKHGEDRNCSEFTPPAQKLSPHAAAIGMKFYDGTKFPEKYQNQIFIAEHGSWNRSDPIGYRVAMVTLQDGKPNSYTTFIDGWLNSEEAWGRPADILILPDGSMLVSDDKANKIYRVTYEP